MIYFKTIIVFIFFACFVHAQMADHPVIAEVYGGGGNSGSYYKYDYIILYNPVQQSVDVSGWSVQYASATSASWSVTNLEGIIPGNAYYVIQQKGGTKGGEELPMTPDIVGSTSMATTGGKIALVKHQEELSVNDPSDDENIVDFVGYGTADAFEGSAASPSPSNTESIRRLDNSGGQTMGENGSGYDSDDNSADFFVAVTNSENPPLPVELVSFNINTNGNSILLKWETATEVNNYGFEIERALTSSATDINHISGGKEGAASNIAAGWEKIGFVKGNGNSNSAKKYMFADFNIQRGFWYKYRLKQIDNDGKYFYSSEKIISLGMPDKFELFQNYPNPFNPTTIISYEIPKSCYVEIKVYNILGCEIITLINEEQPAGKHAINFDGKSLGSGVYFYRLRAGDFVLTKSMSLTK